MDRSSSTIAEKAALRSVMLARRAAMPEALRIIAAERLAGHAGRLAALVGNGILSAYVAFRGEIDPAPLLLRLHAAGVPLALPRVAGRVMTFHCWTPDAPLVPGPFGIQQPDASAAVIPSIILAPLAAFDRYGHRLGYGGGYYDRALAGHAPRAVIGLAYATQAVDRVPAEPHDRRLDAVITELGWLDSQDDPEGVS